MNTQNLTNKQSIKAGIFYGFVSISAICMSSLLTLDSNTKYNGNLLTTALTFGILIFGIILCYKTLNKSRQIDNLYIGQLALTGIFFSLTVGLIGGLIHYIDATFIDTHYAQNALKSSQTKWTANTYSKEAIAGQIELTDTFQSSWKWAVTSGIFMVITSLFLFITVGCFNKLTNNKEKGTKVA